MCRKQIWPPMLAFLVLALGGLACGSSTDQENLVRTLVVPATEDQTQDSEIAKSTDISASATPAPAITSTAQPTAEATLGTTTLEPSPTSQDFSRLIVPAGELHQYQDVYPLYSEVYVTKLDGTLDPRANDLEELCLDWLFYRDRIIEYSNNGDEDKADDARTSWNQINLWLDEYNEDDIGAMWTIVQE